MYVYIYDDYLNKPKYSRVLNKLEIRLTDLGLGGKIIRLGTIKNVKDLIQSEIKTGAKTIIAVGNNQTINKIIGAVVDNELYGFFQKNILLFIIPVGDNNSIADSLGIKKDEACETLLARRIKKIDIGTINNKYFLNKVSLESLGADLEIGNNYSLEIKERGQIDIINLANKGDLTKEVKSNPQDGLLDLYIKTKGRDYTYLTVKKLKINNKNWSLLIDEGERVSSPAEIGAIKEKLNFIVGKDREFE
ncbi:MAG: diacylglycerol kinase family protein [Candidatus Falkowbacteria bacterium]|nr:diacylglycerol kinase family protein [Candidatus Falkowbacteria bacterium]